MLKKINYIFDKRQKRNMFILSAIIFIGSFMELLGVSAIMPLVTIIMDESVLTTKGLYVWLGHVFHLSAPREYILIFTLFLIAVYIIKNVYIIFQNNIQMRYVYNNQRRLSTKMMDCYLKQDYLYHVARNVGDLQRNVSSDTNSFYSVVLAMIQLESEALVCILLIMYLLYTNFSFTVAVVLMLGLAFGLFLLLYRRYSVKLGNQYRQLLGAQNKWILQAFTGIKEIKVMNKEQFFLDNYDRSYEKSMIAQRKNAMLGIFPKPIIESICICGILSVIAVQTYLGMDLKNFVPMLSVFAVAAFRMLPSFSRLSAYINSILFGKSAVDNVYQDLKEIEELLKKNPNREDTGYHFELNKNIELKHVTFQYPGGEKEVLKDISFEISPNQSIAFIGPSGAGKTTLADIILGILTPQSGKIEVNGESIFRHIESWHENIGYIPQMIYLMDESIRNNVAFGCFEKEIDEDRVWKALKEAQLEEFVRSLPQGLDTKVGDRGVKLSGGQRQRIGIARALYTDPKLLILDEATSALDNETETAVMEAIDHLHGSRTMIIIAHRLTTIRNCDKVYEVNHQTVTERNKKDVIGS